MDLEQIYQELQNDKINITKKYAYSHPIKTKDKIKNMSLGRIWFNLLLPDDYMLIDKPITKSVLSDIMSDIIKKYDSQTIATTYDNIQKESFKMSAIVPISIGINDVILDNEIEKDRKKLQDIQDPIKFQQEALQITKKYMNNKPDDNSLSVIINSKAGSSIGDISNLMIGRGSIVNIANEISDPIKSALNDGLNINEYYEQAKESRRTLYIRSKGAADPGYLARKIIFANASIQIGSDDCKTKKYLTIKIKPGMQKQLIGRYIIGNNGKLQQITEDFEDLTYKIVKLRSPLYCIEPNNNICKTCYGELINKLKTKNIGILAGNVMNTAGVESYAMKARHMASQVNFSKVDFEKDIIIIE